MAIRTIILPSSFISQSNSSISPNVNALKYRVNADIIKIPFRGSCSISQPLVFATGTHIVAITFPPAGVK